MNITTHNPSKLILTVENVDHLKEAKTTLFGFSGKTGVIRNSEKNDIIGFSNFQVDTPTISLMELEIIPEKQNQGYGKLFIQTLFKEYPETTEIIGLATEESEGFYISIGADFNSFCNECDVSDCSYNPEYQKEVNTNFYSKCDDYSTLHFKILKENIIPIT